MKTVRHNNFITVRLFSVLLVLGLLLIGPYANAQMYFANFEGSQVKISGNAIKAQAKNTGNNFSCEGNFKMKDGELQSISSLKFSLATTLPKGSLLLTQASGAQNINFELTNAMVLPLMQMVHVIGFLDIEGVRRRADFQLDFIENNHETITIMGAKSINLNEYKKQSNYIFAAKEDEKILINLKLVIKNPQAINYLALLTNKAK